MAWFWDKISRVIFGHRLYKKVLLIQFIFAYNKKINKLTCIGKQNSNI